MPLNGYQDVRHIAEGRAVWKLAQPESIRLAGFASITTLGFSCNVRTSRADQACEAQGWGTERTEQPCLNTGIVSQA